MLVIVACHLGSVAGLSLPLLLKPIVRMAQPALMTVFSGQSANLRWHVLLFASSQKSAAMS